MKLSLDYDTKLSDKPRQPRSSRGVSGDDPEGGAGRGVLRRWLVTACPGRPGESPARHYDLAARSSLHGSGACRRRKRDPGGKTAPVERREASVPRYGTQGASQATGVSRHDTPHGCRCTRTFLGAPPTPRFGLAKLKLQTPGAKTRRGNESGCLKSE